MDTAPIETRKPPSPNELGARLRAAREKRGITQGRFAELLGVDQSTVAGWEAQAERRRRPDRRNAELLRRAAKKHLKITLDPLGW